MLLLQRQKLNARPVVTATGLWTVPLSPSYTTHTRFPPYSPAAAPRAAGAKPHPRAKRTKQQVPDLQLQTYNHMHRSCAQPTVPHMSHTAMLIPAVCAGSCRSRLRNQGSHSVCPNAETFARHIVGFQLSKLRWWMCRRRFRARKTLLTSTRLAQTPWGICVAMCLLHQGLAQLGR